MRLPPDTVGEPMTTSTAPSKSTKPPASSTQPGTAVFAYRMPHAEAHYPQELADALSRKADGLPVSRSGAVALAVREAHARYVSA